MSHAEHKARSPASVGCFVLTVSDTRTDETDAGGRALVELLQGAGHVVVDHRIVRDETAEVRAGIQAGLVDSRVQAVIATGGTGISRRDRTCEAVGRLLDRRLEGFGELFRMLSYQEVGASAMLSRALAGTAGGKIVIALPGSEAAVRLAMTRLVLPELGHLVGEAAR